MNKMVPISSVLIFTAAAAFAGEAATNAVAAVSAASAVPLDVKGAESPSRWRISAGARFAPGVKARATTSRRAGGVLSGIVTMSPKAGRTTMSVTEKRTVVTVAPVITTSDTTKTETLPAPESGRYEFSDGSFVDLHDDAGIEGETWNWNFTDVSLFDEGSGTFTEIEVEAGPSDTDHSDGGDTAVSSRTSVGGSESRATEDVAGALDEDLWGVDVSVGYDFYVEGRWSLGLGLGASFYEDADSFATRARCYRGSSTKTETRTTTTASESTDTAVSSTLTTETKVCDPDYAYEGATLDLMNDDGTMGAGTSDGYDNPHGGYNPVISTKRISSELTTDTHTESVYSKTVETLTRTVVTKSSMTVDLESEGSVSTWEARLALQPAYQAADWLEIRGTFGVVMTHVDVDVDSTVFVNGTAYRRLESSDDGYVFAGLCGLDVSVSPCEGLSVFGGVDIRIGSNKFDFDTGLASGVVDLATMTCRAGIKFEF